MNNCLEFLDIRKAFKKDFNTPVLILDKNLFIEQVNLLGYSKELENYLSIVNEFKNLDDFFNYRRNIRNNAIEFIKKNSNYQKLNQKNFDFVLFGENVNYESLIKENNNIIKELTDNKIKLSKNLYTQENLEKEFISIDLKSANFQVLKLLNIVNVSTYKDFLNKFDKYNYFYKSKHIRQYIFGNTNPKKIMNIEKTIMLRILKNILDKINKERKEGKNNIQVNYVVLNNDELVLKYNKKTLDIVVEILKETNMEFNVQIFKLLPLKSSNNKIYYVKDYGDKKTLHTVPNYLYIQAFKKINNIPIEEKDLIFEYEGELAKFLNKQF